ncbi:MAG: hypothetical protein ACRDX9_14815 [Acidimicrobiia bacterium]
MSKFVFLYKGLWPEPTPEVTGAWSSWFEEIGESIVDSGNPFGSGREVSGSGSADLPPGPESITGYTIVNADDIDAAEKLLANCPIVTSVLVYEAMPM